MNGSIKSIVDSYYDREAVKIVSIDCKESGENNPCEIILFIDDNKKIINEMRTA